MSSSAPPASDEPAAAAAAAEALDGPQAGDEARILAEAQRVVSALHAAVKGGDVAAVRKMVQASPVPHMLLNTRDPAQGGLAAVHVAARAGQEAVMALLLEHGACPWLPDKEGLSALDYARVRNRQGCLALLRERIKAAPPQLKEAAPLVASFFEAPVDREWMGWALDHYGAAKLLDAKGRGHASPLHFAMTNNDPQLVDTLLDLGADPFVKDAEGRSPLDVASLSGNPALVRAVSSAMRTQLLAFLGLAGLFLLYRQDGDAQQAWHVLALAWPAAKTLHTLLVLVPQAALPSQRAHLMGEWLTYWGVVSPLLLLEHLTTTKAGRQLLGALVAALTAAEGGSPGGPGDSIAPPAPAVRTVLDVYLMAKIVATLYLVYPACRGARVLYQKWVDPEERAKRAARAHAQGQGQQAAAPQLQEAEGDKRKAD